MYLLFDIGKTNMRVAVSRDGKKLDAVKTGKTPRDFREGMALFRALAGELVGNGKVIAAAGGIAGPLDAKKEKLAGVPSVYTWSGKPLKKEIEKTIGAPVILENDAALGALGEAVFGAGKGKRIVVYVTVSTGVGGARVVDGALDANAIGFEPGYMVVDGGKNMQDLVSGSGMKRWYKKEPKDIKDKKVWDAAARHLGVGIANMIACWSPNVMVIGGPLMHKISLAHAAAHAQKMLKMVFPKIPPVKKAALGDRCGLYGALVLARSLKK